MPTVSYDSRSLMIDGRRIWLVSGSIQYARLPADQWRNRLRAARQAGLNCIETFAVWALHERRRARFDFEHDLDIRRFVQTAGEEGLFCIVRPGPYIGAEFDNGGLPAWLNARDVRLREADGAFLEAVSRWFAALFEQVGDLQVTSPVKTPRKKERDKPSKPTPAASMPGGGNGPIILMQAENEWFCHHPSQGQAYLQEVARYLREAGCGVPIIENNRRWQVFDGAFSTWAGHDGLLADMRQLRTIQQHRPVQTFPLIAIECWAGGPGSWNEPAPAPIEPRQHLRALAQVLAAGAQSNIYPFSGGTNFGFIAGRSVPSRDGFVTTSHDCGAPLSETGRRTDGYDAAKRICTFADQFGHVLAHHDTDAHQAVVAPDSAAGVHAVQLRGSQGDVTFLFRGADETCDSAEVILPSGQPLDVPLGDEPVAWLMCDVSLAGAIELTYTNLRPWALIGKQLLVLFGPAGAAGVVCLEGAPVHIDVPTGATPNIEVLDDITLAVLSTQQVDAAYIGDAGLYIGIDGFDAQGEPLARAGFGKPVLIRPDGEAEALRLTSSRPRKAAPRPLTWTCAAVGEYINGNAEAYKQIDGPASLEKLRQRYGYGWYRLGVKGVNGAARCMAPRWADRLHIYHGGKLECLLGEGPGATRGPMTAKAIGLSDDGDAAILTDNLGRFSAGWRIGEPKGMADHLYEVKTVRLNKPRASRQTLPDPSPWRNYLANFQYGETHEMDTLTWPIKPAGRQPMIVGIDGLPLRCLLAANGDVFGAYDPQLSAAADTFVLDVGKHITGGKNELQLFVLDGYDDSIDPRKHLSVYQTTGALTGKLAWAFAPWSMPDDAAFGEADAAPTGQPLWWRCEFNVSHTDLPLFVEPRGLSKGQLYLNTRNLGRYWTATATGKSVGPQQRYHLPEPWLNADEPNVLTLFDEHGKRPDKVKFVYEDR